MIVQVLMKKRGRQAHCHHTRQFWVGAGVHRSNYTGQPTRIINLYLVSKYGALL